jgi:cold shock CspA family protein
MEGTIKKWGKTYGFIAVDGMEKDVFFHESKVKSGKPLREGQRVRFEIDKDDTGRSEAVNVEIIE